MTPTSWGIRNDSIKSWRSTEPVVFRRWESETLRVRIKKTDEAQISSVKRYLLKFDPYQLFLIPILKD